MERRLPVYDVVRLAMLIVFCTTAAVLCFCAAAREANAVSYADPEIAINFNTINAVYNAGDVATLKFVITNGVTEYETAFAEVYKGTEVRSSALVASANHVRESASAARSKVDWNVQWDTKGYSPGTYTVVAYMKLPDKVSLGVVTQYCSTHYSEVTTTVTLHSEADPSCAVLTKSGEVHKSSSTGVPIDGEWSYEECDDVTKLFIAADVVKVPQKPKVKHGSSTNSWSLGVSFNNIESVEFLCDEQGKSAVSKLEERVFSSTSGGGLSLAEIKNLDKTQLASIGNYAFAGQEDLQEIQLPQTVSTIGDSAFEGCSSLKGISLPSSVASIGSYAFENCENLAFVGGFGATRVRIIEYSTFSGCRSLRSIELPEGLEEIGINAFELCSSLEKITASSPDCATVSSSAFSKTRLDSAAASSSKIIVHRNAYPEFCKSGKGEVWGGRIDVIEGTQGSLAVASVSGLENKTYNGKHQTQSLKVEYGNMRLKEGVDYSLAYNDNVKSGDATVVVSGKGDYIGSQTLEFSIEKAYVGYATVSGLNSVEYSGKPVTPKPVVKLDGVTLKEGVDYELSYDDNDRAGFASVRIEGINNCYGSESESFEITSARITSLVLSRSSFAYTGNEQKPTIRLVKAGNQILKPSDYYVEYSSWSPETVGKYTVSVTGWDNYVGTKSAVFWITRAENKAVVAKTVVKKKFKRKKLKKKAQTVALPNVATKSGKATWKVSAKDKKKALSLKNGKIRVKKGTKKGVYTIKLKASVPATKNYKAATSKVVTVKVTIK